MGCPKVRSLNIGFSFLVMLFLPLTFHFFFIMDFIGLIVIFLLGYFFFYFFIFFFADKRHVVASLNLVNVADLKRVLRFEVFVSEDRQLRAVHLILNFEPLLNNF